MLCSSLLSSPRLVLFWQNRVCCEVLGTGCVNLSNKGPFLLEGAVKSHSRQVRGPIKLPPDGNLQQEEVPVSIDELNLSHQHLEISQSQGENIFARHQAVKYENIRWMDEIK